MHLLKKILRGLRRKLLPTAQDRIINKWWSDGGDYELRFNYDLDKDSLVVDLGGYQGQWTSDLFSRYQCRVIVFEPLSDFAERIRRRFSRNDKIEVYQCGLGGSSRKEMMRICDDSSSLFRDAGKEEIVEIMDVVAWFAEQNVMSVQLMKINIEGGEYELLERLIETGLIGIIENVQVQFHNISKDSSLRMEHIQRCLERTHMPTYQYRFVWENWTRKKE